MRSRIAKDIFSLAGIQIAGYLLPLISLPYLTRSLGAEQFGVYSIVLAILSIMNALIDYGYWTNGTRRVAIHSEDRLYISRLLGAATCVKSIISIFLSTLFLIFANYIAKIDSYIIAAIYASSISSAIVMPWLFQGLGRLTPFSLFNILVRAASVFAIFFLVKSPKDTPLAIWLNITPQILSILYYYVFIRRNKLRVMVFEGLKHVKDEFVDGLHFFLPNAYSVAFTSLGVIGLSLYASKDIVGIYAANERLVKAVASLSGAVNQAIYPSIASKVHGNYSEGMGLMKRLAAYIIPVFAILSVVLSIFGEKIAAIIFGGDFVTQGILPYLSLYILGGSINTFIGAIYMTSTGRQKAYSMAYLFGTLVATCIYFIAPTYVGYHAPAIGLLAGEFAISVYIIFSLRHEK